jgi:hypothetical protein
MKMKEALKTIDEGWVKKPKGFRVHFQKKVNSELVTDYIPGTEEKPMTSDVVAWRVAWKLSEATKSETTEIADGDIVNIYVVDDSGNPVKFYATNQLKVYNSTQGLSS